MPYLVLLLILLALCVWGIFYMKKKHIREEELVQRLRTSEVYTGVYALFSAARKGHVEQVTLTSDDVTITMLHPEGKHLRYVFDHHGIDPLEEDTLSALAQAAAIDLPCLRDTRYYAFHSEMQHLPAGQSRRCYQYNIRLERKDYLLQAIREKNRQISH